MPRDLGIADRLRAEGLKVRETAGWKTRGALPFVPIGSVNHHTAGAPRSAGRVAPSLATVINGRSDLPGPLCHVLLGFDNVCYVIASGRANHAGIPDGGVCRGMRGNTDAWGLEIEHPGTFPLEADRVILAARIHAALLRGKNLPASQVVQHSEWSPSRKIDLATGFSTKVQRDLFRTKVAAALKTGGRVTSWRVEFGAPGKRGSTLVRADRGGSPETWVRNHKGVFQIDNGPVVFRPR